LTRAWRALRRRILTPGLSATKLHVRGFHEKSPAARDLLETIGEMFLTGYGHAAQARVPRDAEEPLEGLPTRFRGFAYEGATMGFAVRDGLGVRRPHLVADFLAGRAEEHIYMAYVGVGWAMARLPRLRWSRLYAPDPLLRWLVLDGYGFHQAYFHTRRYVREQWREERFPWPSGGPSWYATRVIDQGIGRAMWFVGGADARRVASMIDAFPEHRRADLYSGTGLAATYAGGADEDELHWLWEHAGEHRAMLAQGSAFAAGARVRAGLVVAHNEMATEVLCGMTPVQAWKVTEEALPETVDTAQLPSYEVWRQRIASQLMSLRRS
jgi:enediyne biosynthesis protein E3